MTAEEFGIDLSVVSPALVEGYYEKYIATDEEHLTHRNQRPLYKKGDVVWLNDSRGAAYRCVVTQRASFIAGYRVKKSDGTLVPYEVCDWAMYPTKAVAEWAKAYNHYWATAYSVVRDILELPKRRERLRKAEEHLSEKDKQLIRDRYVGGDTLV